jgi:hypothetical protein
MRGVLVVVAVLTACGPPPKTRSEIGVVPDAEALCTRGREAFVLSRYEGGYCGTMPASPPADAAPTCDDLAVTFGCK